MLMLAVGNGSCNVRTNDKQQFYALKITLNWLWDFMKVLSSGGGIINFLLSATTSIHRNVSLFPFPARSISANHLLSQLHFQHLPYFILCVFWWAKCNYSLGMTRRWFFLWIYLFNLKLYHESFSITIFKKLFFSMIHW